MIDKLLLALTLVGEAFEDARTGTVNMADLDLAGQVEVAQKVIRHSSAGAAGRAVRRLRPAASLNLALI